MEVEEEAVIEMIQKLQRLLKFQMDLLVVDEEVADKVDTHVVFKVNPVSFSSFLVLQPDQIGVDQCDHGPLTSPELYTTSCDLHELVSEAIPKRCLNGPVDSIRDYFIHCFGHLMGNIQILQLRQSGPMLV
ncbi:hypothetical protein Tco_0335531 [Tanacetum coccineum]